MRPIVKTGAGRNISLSNGLTLWTPREIRAMAARYTVREIFEGERYRHPGFELAPGDNVIDIGANIGVFALWAAPRIPGGRILAVEPSPVVFDCLRRNVELNGLDRVDLVNAAVGRDGATLDFVYNSRWPTMGHAKGLSPSKVLLTNHKHDIYQQVPTVSLATMMDRYEMDRVHYLKVDCEGGEFDIFREMDSDHWRRIDKIGAEFHEFAPDLDRRELVQILEAEGFEVEITQNWWEKVNKVGSLWARRV
ncbi:FkbM family methyltransferase [Nocardia terpenica]|nr:FkbM family methyltransferase [Nocardia terpenica]